MIASPCAASPGCEPTAGLSFICGAEKPEDLKHIPGTHFLVTSGFSVGAGLKLVDMQAKSLTTWFQGRVAQIRPDRVLYPDCVTPPDTALFNARGMSLRRTGRGRARLHVINHGGREAVEIFDIISGDKRSAPLLAWRGCLLLPDGHVGNATTTYRDGTVLVSVLTRPGTTITDFELGKSTGAIFERGPTEKAFRLIPGTELPGNNGLEAARDDSGFYVVAFGMRAVAFFRRGRVSGPDHFIPAPGFMPDNIHWNGRRLLIAGMISDEPECGGKRQIIDGVADRMLCHRGWRVAALNPQSKQFSVIAAGHRNARHNGVSQALIVGKTIWLGSYQADRIAFQRFRWPKSVARPELKSRHGD